MKKSSPYHTRWGRENVHLMNGFIADVTGKNFTGPADNERYPQCGFEPGEIGAAPWAAPTVPRLQHLRAVVGRKDEDRVALDPELVHHVQKFTDVSVNLRKCVGPEAVARFTVKLRSGQYGHVNHRIRNVCEEGFASSDLARHEVFSFVGKLPVNNATLGEIVDLNVLGASPFLPSMTCSATAKGSDFGRNNELSGQYASSVELGMPYHSSKP